MRISVVVPAYNEAGHIAARLKNISRVLQKAKLGYEIILVNDGSTDGTSARAEACAKAVKNMRIVGYGDNRGKGGAVKYGMKFCRYENTAFIDADADIDPTYLVFLLKNMSGADVAILSKNHKDSSVTFPLYRKLLSKAYYGLARALFHLPISDTQVGCKVFRKRAAKRVFPLVTTRKFAFDLETLAIANKMGFRIAEFPAAINFSRRKSRIKARNVFSMLWDTLIIFLKLKLGTHAGEM